MNVYKFIGGEVPPPASRCAAERHSPRLLNQNGWRQSLTTKRLLDVGTVGDAPL